MRIGIHDERTRIVFFLPSNNASEANAVNALIALLKQRRQPPPGRGKITGFTQSRSIPAAFEGFYWSANRRRWILDRVVLLTVDHEFHITDSRLHAEIDEWKQTIATLYLDHGSRQDEIWVITHPVWRYD
jgi:hypothetical protein